ncbi:MAG: hypothetical protein ACYDDI_16655 [Candidatus Acidiferrales bacterium]
MSSISAMRKETEVIARIDVPTLSDLAVRGLERMYDPHTHRFCLRLKQTERGLVTEGFSHRYTLMSLLGLYRLEAAGAPSPIPVRAETLRLLEQADWLDNVGDLGLLLWLVALAAPEEFPRAWSKLEAERALQRYPDVRRVPTMEMSWFLTGLSHAALARTGSRPNLERLARETWSLLKKNWGHSGFFGHQARRGTLEGFVRGHVGSFADQIYPVYALARFAQAFQDAEALSVARACGEALCVAQGPLGQWWWHYDSAVGRVAGRYPVYSVHQDGMAPMALFALGEAASVSFEPFIWKGLDWITGRNELECDLRVLAEGLIWRCIYRPSHKQFTENVLSSFCPGAVSASPQDLDIRFECRAYHLGWLLYAFAGR